jgi:hypothetical protein
MSDGVFNIAKGAATEKVRDSATVIGVMLTKSTVADATMKDYDTVAAILAGATTELTDGSYARKTGLTATLTVDDTNDRVDLDIANQTWTALAGAEACDKLIVFYEESASDAGRVPLTYHDFVVTTDGTDVTAEVTNFFRAS